jgi:hypothetical protein
VGGDKLVDEQNQIDDCLAQLLASGWSVGDTAFTTETRELVWLVWGTNGENVIRAEGPTQAEAWRMACDQARAVGMLAGWRVSEAGVG